MTTENDEPLIDHRRSDTIDAALHRLRRHDFESAHKLLQHYLHYAYLTGQNEGLSRAKEVTHQLITESFERITPKKDNDDEQTH